MLNRFLKVAFVAGLVAVPVLAFAQQPAQSATQAGQALDPQLKAALDVTVPKAQSFVTALDNKQFAQALAMTAPQFRQSLGSQSFEGIITGFQQRNGAMRGRQIVGAGPVNPPPEANAPAGRYMAVQYQTMFATTGANLELVVMHEVSPNNWQIAGYFANPAGPEPGAAPQQPAR